MAISRSNLTAMAMDVFVSNELAPEPVGFPHQDHLFNGDILGLREEKGDEDGHNHHPSSKEVEEAKLHVAEHCEKYLGNDEGEEHVDGDIDTLPGRSDLQRKYLTGYQPTKGTP